MPTVSVRVCSGFAVVTGLAAYFALAEYSFVCVWLPACPSPLRPFARWKALTALVVVEP